MTHTPLPWRDPGEHEMTGYGDINHVVVGADEKLIGSIYANCFGVKPMNHLPTIPEARANAALIVRAVNSHAALVKALEGIERGCTAVLISAALDECPVNPKVLEQIVKDARAALVAAAHDTKQDADPNI